MVRKGDGFFIRSIRSGYGMGIRFMGKCDFTQHIGLRLCELESVSDFRLVKERRAIIRE